MSNGGKGDKPRPFSVPKEVYDERFETIFGKKRKTESQKFDEMVVMKNEYFEIEDNNDSNN